MVAVIVPTADILDSSAVSIVWKSTTLRRTEDNKIGEGRRSEIQRPGQMGSIMETSITKLTNEMQAHKRKLRKKVAAKTKDAISRINVFQPTVNG